MKKTGERLHSDIKEYWAAEHYHRYAIAAPLVKNKIVLDIASGEGYGTHYLSAFASSIIGVDLSGEAVAFAKQTYIAQNLSYQVGSADNMPIENSSVDVVTSFETIEHHDKHEEMMIEVKRVLNDNGMLIISSPDKKNYSDIPEYNNPFHIKELYKEQFQALLSRYFKHFIFLSQKTVYGSLILLDNNCDNKANFREYSGNIKDISESDQLTNPLYNIAICSDAPIDTSIIKNSFFNSETTVQSITDNYTRQLTNQQKLIDSIYNDRSFKIGKLITAPYRFIKGMF
ncbi:class I SAM-dependent methyltransferase [Flavitalea antarctica]